jgi:glycosyltransferase involved in cell wall biosynthesis
MDKISILIPTYNRNLLLKEALESIQTQNIQNWEAVIVDNSGRKTAKSVVDKFQDNRFIYIPCDRNLGECGGRNLAFSHSSGNYICYLDDDDLLLPDSLKSRIEFLQSHSDSGMIYAEFQRFHDLQGNRIPLQENVTMPYMRKSYYDNLLERLNYSQKETFYFLKKFNFIRGGTPLIHRSTLETVGLFDENLVNFGNYEMWLRIAARFSIRFLNKVVYYYRIHKGSILQRTGREIAMQCAHHICQRYQIKNSIQFSHLMTNV